MHMTLLVVGTVGMQQPLKCGFEVKLGLQFHSSLGWRLLAEVGKAQCLVHGAEARRKMPLVARVLYLSVRMSRVYFPHCHLCSMGCGNF